MTDRLRRLAQKYRALAVLRARREEVEAQGHGAFEGAEAEARLTAFRELAAEFPGALRELDGSTSAELRAKASAVEDELGGGPARDWVRIVLDFHETLRDALRVKLWLAQRVGRDGWLTDEIASEAEHLESGQGLRAVDRRLLEKLHHPPGGRVLSVVWEMLSDRHGLDKQALVEAIFCAKEIGS